jgi:hypothetical protein
MGGIQIDVFPAYPTNIKFAVQNRNLSIYKTPAQLGLKPGTLIQMTPDKSYMCLFLPFLVLHVPRVCVGCLIGIQGSASEKTDFGPIKESAP